MLLEGLQLPLTTPFYPDGRLNLLKLEHNVARYSRTPVAGLVALSDFGESTMLSEEEARQLLRGVAGAAKAEKVLIAGVSRDSVVGTLDLIESAAVIGYDAVLVKAPSLFRAKNGGEHSRQLLTYFQTVADRAALPVVLHSEASDAGRELPSQVLIELALHPQVIGLVDEAGGQARLEMLKTRTIGATHEVRVTMMFGAVTGRMRVQNEAISRGLLSTDSLTGGNAAVAAAPADAAVKTRTKVVGFQMLAGSTAGMLDGLRAGVVGAMPAFAAAAPQACYEVLAAWKDGDEGLAEEKQARLRDVAGRVEEQLGVAGIKFGCDLNGYFGGRPRLPLLPLTSDERAEVEAIMRGLRN